MNIAIIGLGHAFSKQYNALNQITKFTNIELCDNNQNKIRKYHCKDNYLSLKSNHVIIATSPKLHLEMIKNLSKQDKQIIVEKPIVTSLKELQELEKHINKDNYYNSLHFSFGTEIDYFLKHINLKPNKIYSYISDNYVLNNKIKDNAVSLCGTYLDEVINPLSAIGRMFGYNIKFISNSKKIYPNDIYDYYSLSHFKVDDIPVAIEVLWDNNPSQKYIDLYYDNFIIRLDSMNQSVIDLTNKKVLFKGQNDRMTNHYIGVFNDYIKNKSNYEISIKLHKELLKGVNYEN